MTIWVTSRNLAASWAQRHGAKRAVSLLAPGDEFPVIADLPDKHHLKLALDDIDTPMEGLRPPQEADVKRLIAFVEDWDRKDPILIHCWAGVSRSSASAFITACLHNPDADERDIAGMVRAASPTAKPNKRMVAIADDLLGRKGRMKQAVDSMGPHEIVMEAEPFKIPSLYDKVRGHWI